MQTTEVTVASANEVFELPFSLDTEDEFLEHVSTAPNAAQQGTHTACLWYLMLRFTDVIRTPATFTSQPFR